MNGIVWIIDSGATDHMTSNRSLLFDIIIFLVPYLVSLPNGYKVKVTNGPSVRKLVVFGRLDNGFYKLFQHVTSPVESVNANSCSFIVSSLPIVSNNVVVDNSSLIHIYTWGPYSTPTHSGSKYFLTIVYDYTRATWIHLMGAKSNVLDLLKVFILMVETQFQTRVQTVRSDNALEDVTFHEHIFPFKSFIPSSPSLPSPLIPGHFSYDSPSPLSPSVPVSSPQFSLISTPPSPSPSFPNFTFSPSPISSSPFVLPSSPPPLRRSGRPHTVPSYLQDYVCLTLPLYVSILVPYSSESVPLNATTSQLHIPEPYTYSPAAAIPEWHEAMRKEFETLEANRTWDIIELPPGKKPIDRK
ncbi:uncharacterized protein [Nicotiana sylvestris]|uniref:uncharacterized protein n=1 Tax=Nicotiana sylvestris TaxID=4096 RepID=UPI00388C4515